MMRRALCLAGWAVLMLRAWGFAQAPPPGGDYVSRQEYERLLRQQEAMQKELDALRRERSPATMPSNAGQNATAETRNNVATQDDLEDVRRQIDEVRNDADRWRPGISQFIIAGDAETGFTTRRKNTSTFDAGFAPLFLWRPTDRLLFEAALDISASTNLDASSQTDVSLELANVSYIVNDYLVLGGGLFTLPFGVYHNHFDPPWINKFPDDPLAFGDGGIVPTHAVGIFARGVTPLAGMKVTYDAYVSNGPNLIVSDPGAAGSLSFDDFTDLNENKAVGGRIGLLPIPSVEMGYSILYAKVNPNHFGDVHALLQALDINWRQQIDALAGTIEARAEWAFSNVERATYDPRGTLGFGPVSFGNYRTGGYVQGSYRPTQLQNPFLRNLELVGRWDLLRSSTSAPGGDVEQRWTLGLDYWVTPQAVMKIAYEWDRRRVESGENAFLVQFGIGL